MKKIKRVAVLMGGPSNERDISIKSGKAVCSALKDAGYQVMRLDPTGRWQQRLTEEKTQVAFIALHGRFGEDGTVQSILESMKIPYTGSGAEASRLALDKIISRAVFSRLNIPVPEYKIVTKGRGLYLDKDFRCPIVVKPVLEGSSIGLTICEKKKELKKAVNLAFSYGDRVILERYIPGSEITVGIFDGKALPVIQIVPKRSFYDYKAKYTSGLTEYLVPAPISRKVYKLAQRIALLAHKGLGCKAFSRVDMIYGDDGQVRVLELNSIPGLTPLSLLPKAAEANGISFEQLCTRLVKLAANEKTF